MPYKRWCASLTISHHKSAPISFNEMFIIILFEQFGSKRSLIHLLLENREYCTALTRISRGREPHVLARVSHRDDEKEKEEERFLTASALNNIIL